MQKIRERVLAVRDKVYQENEEEVRKRWHFEEAVSIWWLTSNWDQIVHLKLIHHSFLWNEILLHNFGVCFIFYSALCSASWLAVIVVDQEAESV